MGSKVITCDICSVEIPGWEPESHDAFDVVLYVKGKQSRYRRSLLCSKCRARLANALDHYEGSAIRILVQAYEEGEGEKWKKAHPPH